MILAFPQMHEYSPTTHMLMNTDAAGTPPSLPPFINDPGALNATAPRRTRQVSQVQFKLKEKETGCYGSLKFSNGKTRRGRILSVVGRAPVQAQQST